MTGVDDPNVDPVAAAGPDQSITLPTNSVTLDGSGSSDTSPGSIVSYQWERIGTGGTANITSPNSGSTTITGLTQGSYTFSLTVTDDQGATGTDDVVITVGAEPDTTASVITLVGGDVTLFVGQTYVDPGYSAADNVDGDITASVVVGGLPDINTMGDYTVTYNVNDTAGNFGIEQTRIVRVDSAPTEISFNISTGILIGPPNTQVLITLSITNDGNAGLFAGGGSPLQVCSGTDCPYPSINSFSKVFPPIGKISISGSYSAAPGINGFSTVTFTGVGPTINITMNNEGIPR